jgi:hypothetical protein
VLSDGVALMWKHGWLPAKRRLLDMGGEKEEARNLREQEPGRDKRHAIAAHIPTIAENIDMRQALRLRVAYGLTEAHALALASLVWGAA